MSEVLAFEGVSVRRGDKDILSDVTWTVADEDRWVVLGPNGAGKTTLMSIAAGRLHPTGGTVDVLGERLGRTDLRELHVRVGLSSVALADHIPARETVKNVVMTASQGTMGRWNEDYESLDEDRADALLWAFGMAGFADREFGTLSEGERKRTQVARALMADPELLLLDEPAAGLDLGGREELLLALTELAGDRRSPAIVMVTHHVEEIPVGFTHALLLRDGGVVAAGPIDRTLTAQALSDTFGMPIALAVDGGRYSARRAS
ncbi:ABC transporter ATP-binding protein [Demequina sp. SYSU T00039]|uniref:ABC transporter ATP-binding protein n=1 Tax=Demequina lignilytica TaxID=3051663 RepID=A0AAW7M966_9MICO|nr:MULTISPECIES: ABC transporter ATP-binding protein [unclassified Demequina]MDN4479063.1 ABC transporter ATP-binding protein [Demequina sp. SYSU T00039-1]MDN4489018.1 ABC transporter ATP-binding protein [Demequina sp. SYSU T00039]MDN4491271.1 ABC transporter ATP-binding protein [Demequina sp. SYSU T00068]